MYTFLGKINQFYKFNANCKESEKQGKGPGSCGGNKNNDITINRIYRDNPGKEWLSHEREYAKKQLLQKGRNFAGAVTASFEGRLPTKMLASLHGVNNEHNIKNILNDFKSKPIRESIRNEGVREPIMLYVGFDGTTKIAEGNHRVALANEFRLKDVPVDIRYFAGGELVDGNFKLRNFEKETNQKYIDMENQIKQLSQVKDINNMSDKVYDIGNMSDEEFFNNLKKDYDKR
jgi:hypothetical protein